MKISFVVPTYMEELNIKTHYKECIKSFYKINEKFSFSPEINFNFVDYKDNNHALVLQYLINEKKSIDFFVTSAMGIQDMSQLIKSKDNKMGVRLNLLL